MEISDEVFFAKDDESLSACVRLRVFVSVRMKDSVLECLFEL
jgi:hypothetical protein